MKTFISLIALSAALLSVAGAKRTDDPKPSKWKAVTITTYGRQYHGRRTASGKRHDEDKLSCAVRPIRNKRGKIIGPSIPYGTKLTVSYNGHSVKDIVVLDVCPAGTLDLSGAAMRALLQRDRNINTKVKGRYKVQ